MAFLLCERVSLLIGLYVEGGTVLVFRGGATCLREYMFILEGEHNQGHNVMIRITESHNQIITES